MSFHSAEWVLMLSRNNILIVALLAAQFCYLLILSPKKTFWCDEVLTYEVVNQSSFSEMWQAANDTVNESPPLYFVALWLWKHVAGIDPMALRLFSALCMMTTTWIWWRLLSKAYSPEAATLGVVYCFGLSFLLQYHIADARQYALLSLFMSIACSCVYSMCLNKKISLLNGVGYTLASMGLIYTHYFGVLYSAGITAAGILMLWKNRKAAFILFFISLLAWGSFIPWLPTLKLHQEVASQCSWYFRPNIGELLEVLSSQALGIHIFLPLILLCLAGIRYTSLTSSSSASVTTRQPAQDKPTLLPIACMMVGIVVFVYFYSLFVHSMFKHRYMICSYPLWAILIAHLGYWCLSNKDHAKPVSSSLARSVLNILCVAMIGCLIVSANAVRDTENQAIMEIVSQRLLPVIDEHSLHQLPRWYLSATPERYVFILNTADYGMEYGSNIGPPRFLADVVKYADRLTAMTIEKFLETTDEFYLIDRPDIGWANRLILENPAYQCVRLPAAIESVAIYHVKKVK